MLTKFIVKNFKNFENELVFNLSNIKNYEFNSECIKDSTINKAIVYGPNGSGKSNLGFAIFDIVSHLTDKNKKPDFYTNYLFGGDTERIATFQYYFTFDNRTLEYHYGKRSQDEIVFEKLSIDGKDVISIDKRLSTEAKIELKGAETLNKDMRSTKISVIKYILSNSVLENNATNQVLASFSKFVDNMLYFRSLGENSYLGYETGSHSILEDIIKRENVKSFESFLNKAHIKCKLCVEKVNEEDVLMTCVGTKKISFWLTASTGTKSLALFYYWLQRLQQNTDVSFLFIDEYDAFYHFSLSKLLVKQIKKTDPQTIITTHNTSIMSNDLLRPDCYFILENNKIYPLYEPTMKELRKAHNIEKMYKAGAFNK